MGARWFAVMVAIAAFALPSCRQKPSDRELRKLEVRQHDQEARLASLQKEIDEAERRLEAAKRTAELERCHADAAGIEASVASRAADCAQQTAAAVMCDAANEQTKGKSLRTGCELGLLAAIATGGSALLLVGGGCLAGEASGDAEATACPEPQCLGAVSDWMRDAARATGHTGLPICELGFEAIDAERAFDGALVIGEVSLGAEGAGLGRGDAIVAVNTTRIRSADDLGAAVGGLPVGKWVMVKYVRQAALKSTKVKLTGQDGDAKLGVTGQPVSEVPYVETVIVDLSSSGRASKFGLKAGDVVAGFADRGPLQAGPMSRALRDRPGAAVTLKVTREGKLQTIKLAEAKDGVSASGLP